MLNELYTFAEPVQVVPFSNLKWGKFTLLHTDISIVIQGSVADIETGREKFSVWLECRKIKQADLVCISADKQEQIKSAGCKYLLIHSERGKVGYWAEIGKTLNFSVWERQAIDEDNEKALIYELMHPYTA